jgi:hypothetical protein
VHAKFAAVGLDADRAVRIRPEHLRAAAHEPLDDVGRGVAEEIGAAGADERNGRRVAIDESLRRRRGATVMRDFQDAQRPARVGWRQGAFDF